jgi:hypothetical protein
MIRRLAVLSCLYLLSLALIIGVIQTAKWGVRQMDSWKQCIAKGGDAMVAPFSMDVFDVTRVCVKEVK